MNVMHLTNITPQVINYHGGEGIVAVWGTFGGANITVEVSFDGTTYMDLKDISNDTVAATTNEMWNIKVRNCKIRATSDDTTDVYVGIM